MQKPTDYEYEERAAILEYDAGMARPDAEREALQLVARWRAKCDPRANADKWRDVYRKAKVK